MAYQVPSRTKSLTTIIRALLIALFLLSPLRPGDAAAQDGDAAALLSAAATVMGEVDTFHFELSTPRGETRFAENLMLLSLSGDVQRPDRFRASAMVDATIAQLEIQVVGIGPLLWVSDPLSAETAYIAIDLGTEDTGVGPSLADLVNPDRLLLTAVDAIEDPTIVGQDEIDGVMTTRINGVARLDPLRDAGLAGTPVAGTMLLGQPVQVAIWVDADNRVRQLDVYGPLLEAEAPNTVRRLKLSAFDEPIDIQPPLETVQEGAP